MTFHLLFMVSIYECYPRLLILGTVLQQTINQVLPYPAYEYIIVPSLLASEEKHLACPQKTAESALAAQQGRFVQHTQCSEGNPHRSITQVHLFKLGFKTSTS